MKILLITALIFFSSIASADDWLFSGKLGTSGFSLEMGKPLGGSINGRVATNLLTYSDTANDSLIDNNTALDLKSAGLLIDWYPGKSTFRFTVGGYYHGNETGLNARPVSSNFNINGALYPVNDVGSFAGGLSYGSSAPYLGVGWGNINRNSRGWGMAWDLGVLYQGFSDVSLDVACAGSLKVSQCTSLAADVGADSHPLRTDVENQKWLPVFSMGILYRF